MDFILIVLFSFISLQEMRKIEEKLLRLYDKIASISKNYNFE